MILELQVGGMPLPPCCKSMLFINKKPHCYSQWSYLTIYLYYLPIVTQALTAASVPTVILCLTQIDLSSTFAFTST